MVRGELHCKKRGGDWLRKVGVMYRAILMYLLLRIQYHVDCCLSTATIARTRDLFVIYAKKSAFNIDEYSEAGAVSKRLTAAQEASLKDGAVEVDETDVKYNISAINVCSQRVPTELQNYKPISELVEVLTTALKLPEDVVEELEEKSSVTEL